MPDTHALRYTLLRFNRSDNIKIRMPDTGVAFGIRQKGWSEAAAIGSEGFVYQIKRDMGVAVGRRVKTGSGIHMLREADAPYSIDFDTKTDTLSAENTMHIDVNYIESIG